MSSNREIIMSKSPRRSARLAYSPALPDSASTAIREHGSLPALRNPKPDDSHNFKRRRLTRGRSHDTLPNVVPTQLVDLPESAKLSLLQEKPGYTFKDQDLARAALNMTELSKDHDDRKLKSSVGTSCQNLAILGDLAMELAMADKWFEIASTPTIWDTTKQRITTNVALAQFCIDSGLFQCYGGPCKRSTTPWKLATVVEAVLGAIFLDSGKSLAAVHGAMEGLGILQAGMKALEAAELTREAEKARNQDVQAAKRGVNGHQERKQENKKKRTFIEISDDDEYMEEPQDSSADDEDGISAGMRRRDNDGDGQPSMEMGWESENATSKEEDVQ